ncbi:UNVERIFIED_CONTAM: hypothetical protein GTU68_001346 [Idotea baltica]|nr:hypothetical protein [Idotea baltica]
MSHSRTSFTRLLQIRRVVKKYGLHDLFDRLDLSPSARLMVKILFGKTSEQSLEQGTRIRKALEELGPVFIKLGQALSTRPDLLPPDIALELSKLQDQVPPFSGERAITIIKDAFGDEYESTFESVSTEPMASASVAQVHTATLKSGLAIQGKVLRPDIEKIIDSDLSVMHTLARLLQKHWARGEQFKPAEVIQEYDNTIHGELDLRLEAANCSQMAANFEDSDLIYVPQVYWDYCHQDVLVMERIYGTSIREFDTLTAKGIDLEKLGNEAVEVFFKQAFEDNFFHADMHPGNIFVSDQGMWIAVDFGIMGTLNDDDKSYLAEMLMGFFNRDYRAIADAHLRAKWIPEGTRLQEFESAIRMVCEPNFAKPISEISFGRVLLQLFQTVRKFEIPVQPQLVLLYKTLLNIEGLGRQLHPQLNLWDTAKPFLEQWMKQQMSPQALIDDFKRDWPRWRAALPKLLDTLEGSDSRSNLYDEHTTHAIKKQIVESDAKRFHQHLGIGTAICGLTITLLAQNNVLSTSLLVTAAPWLGIGGLVWALYKSRQ